MIGVCIFVERYGKIGRDYFWLKDVERARKFARRCMRLKTVRKAVVTHHEI